MTALPIDLEAFDAAPLTREPFAFAMVPRFVKPDAMGAINADYPLVAHPGSFPLPTLQYGPAFADFMAAIQGPEFTRAVERKLGVDLKGRPTMVTARGVSAARDGQIHTDSRTKLITVLIYMNNAWEAKTGRLRLLRGPDNLEDVIAEVPPDEGTHADLQERAQCLARLSCLRRAAPGDSAQLGDGSGRGVARTDPPQGQRLLQAPARARTRHPTGCEHVQWA